MTDPTRKDPSGLEADPSPTPDLWAQPAPEKIVNHADASAGKIPGGERDVLEKLVFATLSEQRSARRRRVFTRLAWLVFLIAVAWVLLARDVAAPSKTTPHTAVVDIKGEIAAGGRGGGGRLGRGGAQREGEGGERNRGADHGWFVSGRKYLSAVATILGVPEGRAQPGKR